MSLYRRPNSGFWWVRFTVGGRRIRQSTGTANRKQAEEYETVLRSRLWREKRLGQPQHTVAEAAERYLSEAQHDTTKDAQRLGWFLQNKAFANLPLTELTREVLESARAKLTEGRSHSTCNHYMAVIRAVLRKAQFEWEWVSQIPKVPMYRTRLPEPRWLTREQFERLVEFLPPHTADLARIAVATGLRRSNITGLSWDRVDLEERRAYIPGSQAKGKKGIPVALNDDAIEVLKRWRGEHEHWVFVWKGRRITQVATKAWRAACVKAGLAGLRFHDLRHTWASWQVQAETPLSVLQDLGGWSSFEMVRRYAHLSPGHLREYANRTLLAHKKTHRR